MYSVLPAVVSILFLGCGFYALASRGFNRISSSFFLLCITTFFWQGTWAALFQIEDPKMAQLLVKFGYFFILFLPTSLYHFLAEICGRVDERRYVYFSYALAAILALLLPLSDLVVSGFYRYFWGFYPKAGALHPIHLLQTAALGLRALYIAYRAQKNADDATRTKLRLCLAGVAVYFLAAIDYLCNYGIEFYPPGVIFIAVTLNFFTIAMVRYDLLDPMALAATVAHEMRTPLAIIRLQAVAISKYWPALFEGYQLAVKHGLLEAKINKRQLDILANMSKGIASEVDKSNAVIDMMLASTSMEHPETLPFERHFINECITDAIARYPLDLGKKDIIHLSLEKDFEFYGSKTLLICVLFNLLKNSVQALKSSGKGEILISSKTRNGRNILSVTDTGPGIPQAILPHIFEPFFSTKQHDGGSGIGLSFCKKVMEAFAGSIRCYSIEGEYTTFTLEFPPI